MCILNWIRKMRSNSAEETHWVYHTHDETVVWPNKAMMWANLHGFNEGPDTVYWIGLDIRTFGIRSCDYLIKCKNRATYEKYISKAANDPTGLLSAMKNDPNLSMRTGDDVNIEYIFRWGDEDKSFDIHLGWDWYAEEK